MFFLLLHEYLFIFLKNNYCELGSKNRGAEYIKKSINQKRAYRAKMQWEFTIQP